MVPMTDKPPGKRVSFARIGPGRPRNLPAMPVSEAEIARVAATGETAAQMARHHAARAVAVLLQIAEGGLNETARVTAARALAAMGDEAAKADQLEKKKNEPNWLDDILNDKNYPPDA